MEAKYTWAVGAESGRVVIWGPDEETCEKIRKNITHIMGLGPAKAERLAELKLTEIAPDPTNGGFYAEANCTFYNAFNLVPTDLTRWVEPRQTTHPKLRERISQNEAGWENGEWKEEE